MSASREERLLSILLAYLQALDRGEKPNPQAILEAHPDLRAELAEYFADTSKLDKVAKEMKTAPFNGGVEVSPSLGRIRYFGDYELLEEISRGGMGVVYRARQVPLNRVVALKMILKGELASETDRRRFRQEAEAAANLDHPNIVPIYEVGEHEGMQYFSMKLIAVAAQPEGKAISKEQQRSIAATVAKIARAIHYAHQQGILHRDLKPGNILIDAKGEPYVTDFGLAMRMESTERLTKVDAVVGTAAYMPPEQAKSEKVLTTAVDTYSLGAVLYEWLTGRPPFRGPDRLSIVLQVIEKDPIRPRTLQPSIDRDLETICLKCLEKSPHGRYQTALALAEDLDRYVKGEPVLARPPGRLERLVKWVRRKPVLASVYGLAIIALVLGGLSLGAFTMWRQTEAARLEAIEAIERANLANERANLLEYGRTVELAYREYRESSLPRARMLLDTCKPELRGWEWQMVHRLCHEERFALKDDCVGRWALFHPDGQRILTGRDEADYDFALEWDARSGKRLRAFQQANLNAADYSRDGKWLVTIDQVGTMVLWNEQEGKEEKSINLGTRLFHPRFSPDRTVIAVGRAEFGGKDSICLVDRLTFKVVKELNQESDRTLRLLRFSPDGTSIYVDVYDHNSRNSDLISWNITTGKKQRIIEGALSAYSISEDGRFLVSSEWDRSISVWSLKTAKKIAVLQVQRYQITVTCFSPKGDMIAAGDDKGNIAIWYSPSSWEKETHKIGDKLVPIDPHEEIATLKGYSRGIDHLQFSPDSSLLAATSGGDHTTRVWSTPKRRNEDNLWDRFQTPRFALSGDGRTIATIQGEREVAIWDAKSGMITKVFSADFGGFAYDVALNHDGTLLATGGKIGRIWETATGRVLVQFEEKQGEIRRVAFSPNGKLLATVFSANDLSIKNVALRNVIDGTLHKTLDAEAVEEIQFVPAINALATRASSIFSCWNLDNGHRFGKIVSDFLYHYRPGVSPDGRTVVVGNPPALWEIATGKKKLDLIGHDRPIKSAAFSPDGKRIVTGGGDGTAMVWDSLTGISLLTLKGETESNVVTFFTPDGKKLITSGLDRRIKLWDPGSPN